MATKNLVPRVHEEGNIGTSLKNWLKGWFKNLFVSGNITNGSNTFTIVDLQDAIDKEHIHSNKSELDLVIDGDHDVRSDNPHTVTPTQIADKFTNEYEKISINAGDWNISLAPAPALAISISSDTPGLLFDSASTETARFSFRIPNDIDLSVNPILRLILVTVGAEVTGDQYQIQLTTRNIGTGESVIKTIDETIIKTVTGVPSTSLIRFDTDLIFNASLISTNDHMSLALSRLGGDINDTRNGDMALLSAWFVYKKLKLFETE